MVFRICRFMDCDNHPSFIHMSLGSSPVNHREITIKSPVIILNLWFTRGHNQPIPLVNHQLIHLKAYRLWDKRPVIILNHHEFIIPTQPEITHSNPFTWSSLNHHENWLVVDPFTLKKYEESHLGWWNSIWKNNPHVPNQHLTIYLVVHPTC